MRCANNGRYRLRAHLSNRIQYVAVSVPPTYLLHPSVPVSCRVTPSSAAIYSMLERFLKDRPRAFRGLEFTLNGRDCEGKSLDSVHTVLLTVFVDATQLGVATSVNLCHNKSAKRMSYMPFTRLCIGKTLTEWSFTPATVGTASITLFFKASRRPHALQEAECFFGQPPGSNSLIPVSFTIVTRLSPLHWPLHWPLRRPLPQAPPMAPPLAFCW